MYSQKDTKFDQLPRIGKLVCLHEHEYSCTCKDTSLVKQKNKF